jgi:outer membrane protein assembly factor BamB
VIHLSPTLSQLDAFAPTNWQDMNDNDQDLGTLSPALIGGNQVLQVGKTGLGYLLTADHLGGVGGQAYQGQVCNSAYGGTAVDGNVVFVSCRDGLHAVTVTGGSSPRFDVTWSATGSRAGSPVVAGGVVWDVNADGHLQGFDEKSGQRRYDFTVGNAGTSFPSLAAANGALYVQGGRTVFAYRGA